MKKHLIAAAVAGALAVPAMAQVTVYGTADVSVVSTDTTGGVTTTSLGNSKWSTSVIGLKGEEDLGGGLKAQFELQGSMNFNNGDQGASGAAAGAKTFNREAWVGLSGGFGSVRLGRTDVSAAQGVDGVISVAGNLSDFTSDLGADKDNVIRYTSPSISGFSFDVGQANSSTATAKGTSDILGYSVRYAAGPLDVRFGVMTEEKGAGVADDEQMAFGISYNAGFATVALASNEIKSATAASVHDELGVAVSVPLGQDFTAVGAYIDQDFTSTTASDKAQTLLGINKAMSKRTNLYAVYLDTDFTGGTSADKSEIIIGVRHSF